jgi:hypothetical protein
VKPGGYVIMTHRTDKEDQWNARQEQMCKDGKWEKVEITDALPYLPKNPEYADKIKVKIYVYKVCKKDKVDMKVTNQRSPAFYVKTAKTFFEGSEDEDGNKRDPIKELNIQGLGDAINNAVAAAVECEKAGLATVTKMETSYVDVQSRGRTQQCAAMVISLKKK